MKRTMIVFSVLSLFFFTSVLVAQPQQRRAERKAPQRQHIPDLTEEQQAKIQSLRLELEKELLPLKAKVKTLAADLKVSMTAESFDEGKTKNIVEQMHGIHSDIQMARLKHQRAIRDLLTPEQRQSFDLRLLSGMQGRHRAGPAPHLRHGLHRSPGPHSRR
ncbi:MAG: Spy/CpxP family protein refolding chaperone [bacterium]